MDISKWSGCPRSWGSSSLVFFLADERAAGSLLAAAFAGRLGDIVVIGVLVAGGGSGVGGAAGSRSEVCLRGGFEHGLLLIGRRSGGIDTVIALVCGVCILDFMVSFVSGTGDR